MRIGYDIDSLSILSGGIGRYAVSLVNQIARILDSTQSEIYIFYHRSFDKNLIPSSPRLRFIEKFTRVKSNVLRKGIFLPFLIKKLELDMFHGLDHIGIPFLHKSEDCKYVVTIHDLLTRIYPDKFTIKHRLVQNTLLSRVLKKADRIIANSQSTKKDIVRFYPEHKDKIKVIYEGVESKFFPRSSQEIRDSLDKYSINFKYLLFLGTLEPRKNISRVVDAFCRLKEKRKTEHKLVITGRKGWRYKEILKKLESSTHSKDVVFTGFVEDRDLPSLYSGADIFLYPSLYEGFGLPVLEAMACGTPVITSNLSSLPEVSRDTALLVNPRDVQQIALAMERLLEDRELRERLHDKGIERAHRFSWKTAALETLELYRDIIG